MAGHQLPLSHDSSNAHSSSLAQRQNADNDLTWHDFLRTAGRTAPGDLQRPQPPPLNRSDSADRKRRLTDAEQERRYNPYLPVNNRAAGPLYAHGHGYTSAQPGSSRSNAIDLTASPSRPIPQVRPRHSYSRPSAGRRPSETILPRWQPDDEVNKCPVCNTHFSLLFRRHHCRKCGRVVCANCSPHRITIPRQYIVQPPNPYEDEANPNDTPAQTIVNPALGGGEVVRVCNPCVPDPWTPHAYTHVPSPAPVPALPPPRHPSFLPSPVNRDPRTRDGLERERPQRYRNVPDVLGRNRAYSLQPAGTHGSGYSSTLSASAGQNSLNARLAQRYVGRDGVRNQELLSGRQHITSADPMNQLFNPGRADPPPSPGREVAEEDECPVCGIEMPPGDAIRESHINECISTRFGSTPGQSASAPPVANAAAPPPPEAGTSVSSDSTPPVAEGSRPRATSYRPRGMAVYRATEKDCATEDGDPQECVICFEEFQPGDEMGRMECLCKFHRLCIRQWWDTKGTGSCPTHQLHD